MPSSTESWGIEVGANAIKAMHLQKSGSDVKVVDYDILPFTKILTTPDLDVDEAIRVGLDKFFERHQIGNVNIVISVPGHMVFSRFAKLPPVEEKKIPDIVKFESVQQIPFPIDQVEWDYQIFKQTDSPDVEVGIFAITKERVMPWMANFESVGLPVNAINLSPIAALNAVSYDMDRLNNSGTMVLMDVGTNATDLIFAEGNHLWMRTVPIGGNHFTKALEKNFKLTFSKAEKLKREAPSSKYARQIFQAMRPTFVELSQQIQQSIGYYQTVNRDAEISSIIGLGSTFRMSGLRTFLKQQLQVNVDRIERFDRIAIDETKSDDFADNSVVLATAYGLALQGLGMDEINCNLLPAHIMKKQMWRKKAYWFAGAAGTGVAAAVLALIMFLGEQSKYSNFEQDRKHAEATISDAATLTREWNETMKRDNPEARIIDLQSIAYSRHIYPEIIKDIDAGLKAVYSENSPYQLNRYFTTDTDEQKAEAQERGLDMVADALATVPAERDVFYITDIRTDYEEPETRGRRQANTAPGIIVVTVEGYTPRARPEELVGDVFIPALEGAASASSKPYTIDSVNIDTTSEMSISEIRTLDSITAGAGARRTTTTTSGNEGVEPLPIAQPLFDDPNMRVMKYTMSWRLQLKSNEELQAEANAVQEDDSSE